MSPGIFDWIVVSYTGWLRDGTLFDESREGEPLKTQLGKTVTCWQQALGMVAAGARLRVVCPAAIAYRHTGIPGRVPGGAVLTFEVELLEVIPGEDPRLKSEPFASPGTRLIGPLSRIC